MEVTNVHPGVIVEFPGRVFVAVWRDPVSDLVTISCRDVDINQVNHASDIYLEHEKKNPEWRR